MGSVAKTAGIVGSIANPMMALGAATSFIGGGGMDYLNAKQAADAQRDVNTTNMQMSRENMAFQERMSSTAFQRARDDMQKAGLNPMLAAGASESTPSGSMPQQGPVPPVIGSIGSGAKDMIRILQEVRESNARIKNLHYDTWGKGNQAQKVREDMEISMQSADLLRKQNQFVDNELRLLKQHPDALGWMDALNKRGLGAGSALNLFR